MNSGTPLFRKEVFQNRAERLHGEVKVALPLSWQAIGYLLAAAVAVALAFVSTASYSETQTVTGILVPDRGIAPLRATRPGLIAAVRVREGASVTAGSPLVDILSPEKLSGGGTESGQVLAALDEQELAIRHQVEQLRGAAAAETAELAGEADGKAEELNKLDQQIQVQRELLQSAIQEVERVREIASRGYISRRDVLAREEIALSRRQHLAQLQQQRSAKVAEFAAARRRLRRASAAAAAQVASVSSARASVSERRASAQAGSGYVLTAPVAGLVTAVTARAGQPVSADDPLLALLPSGSRLRAELYVPTTAAGNLRVGGVARIAVDAFPLERFGTLPGRIVAVSKATLPKQLPDGKTIPVFLVTVELERPWIMAFGRRQELLPGMTLSARISGERRTLLQQFLNPLFTLANR